MEEANRQQDTILEKLFEDAERQGGIEYIYTLVRVTGLECKRDPLIELSSLIANSEKECVIEKEKLVEGVRECLLLIWNLLNCTVYKAFNPFPFKHLYKGSFPDIIKPDVIQMASEVIKLASENKRTDVGGMLEKNILLSIQGAEPLDTDDERISIPNKLVAFLRKLIEIYNAARLKYKEGSNLYKLAKFEVLEILTNEDTGLCGFRQYFSNGSSAEFIRNEDSTKPLNIRPDSPLTLFVGDLDALTEEWRVGEKKLYEIGAPGRYNKLGEWKPLVYPQRKSNMTDRYQKKAVSLSKDEEIQGALFYIMCTGHQVVEFVVKADIELPWEDTVFGNVIRLWKCPKLHVTQNCQIYDGTYYLNSFDPEEIRAALSVINIALNRMAFTYSGEVTWRPKYSLVHKGVNSLAKLEDKDEALLRTVMERFPNNEDAEILDASIDWYNRGVAARDVFARFLCYYRAVESLALAIAQKKASFDLGYEEESKEEAEQRSIQCIDQKHQELYEQDKIRFVRSAYVECIEGSSAKIRKVIELVFGGNHSYVQSLFDRPIRDAYSLNQIRSRIAHGNLTLLEKDDVEMVWDRIYEIRRIAREFIMRLSCSLKPSDEVPQWSNQRTMAMSAYDPRTCLVTNDEKIFPTDADWKIKPEWCD